MAEDGSPVSSAWDLRTPRWRIVVDGQTSPLAFKELDTVELAASFLRSMGHDVQVLPL